MPMLTEYNGAPNPFPFLDPHNPISSAGDEATISHPV